MQTAQRSSRVILSRSQPILTPIPTKAPGRQRLITAIGGPDASYVLGSGRSSMRSLSVAMRLGCESRASRQP